MLFILNRTITTADFSCLDTTNSLLASYQVIPFCCRAVAIPRSAAAVAAEEAAKAPRPPSSPPPPELATGRSMTLSNNINSATMVLPPEVGAKYRRSRSPAATPGNPRHLACQGYRCSIPRLRLW